MRLDDIAARLRDAFDAPRFCPDDGQAIEVRAVPSYDARTGEPRDRWFWSCPDVRVETGGGSITWTQWAVNRVHVHGEGRPRWFVRLTEQDRDAAEMLGEVVG